MSESRDQIRRDIAERRAAMRATLDQLEGRVRSSAQLRRRALERPLPLLGAAVAAGLAFGRLTASARRPPREDRGASGGWLGTALTALVVHVLYDAARAALPQLRSRLMEQSYTRKEVHTMATTPKDTLISWLKDAHSMESNVIQTLEQHVDQARDYPQIQARLREHLEESRRHADLVESCLMRYGESSSGLKEAVGKIAGFMQGVTPGAAPDTMVKSAMADYATEHFEMAAYRSLIAAATYLGDSETARICEQILSDEERMAKFLDQHLPNVTQDFLAGRAREVSR